MLLSCACAAVPADVIEGEAELADKIMSSDGVVQMNSTDSTTKLITTNYMAYARAGDWANKNWHQILKERGLDDMIIIKNGFNMKDSYCRVALFRYDISGVTADDIGYAQFIVRFNSLQSGMDVPFDVYWMDSNWDEKTVTMNTLPAKKQEAPLLSNCIFGGVGKVDATSALKTLVASGEKQITLMIVQKVNTDSETRINFVKSTELSFPHFMVFKDASAKDEAYVKQLVDDEAANKAIWDHAKQMYDEWYARYTVLKDKPLAKAELIVSDPSQYNKTSYSPGSNPTGTMKEHKTRTYGDLTDMSKYVDLTVEPEFDVYGGIIDPQMRQEATGFFYSTKIGDRWWVIDPIGYPCHIRALSGIVYSYQNSPKQIEAAYELFGTFDKWAIATTRHLMDDLHFNAGASPSTQMESVVNGIAVQKSVGFMSPYGTSIGINNSNGGSTTFSENNTMPVWDPAFVEYADVRAKTIEDNGWVDDTNILGFTTDNALPMQA